MQEKKEVQATESEQLTYEEELKALRMKWAGKRKEEKAKKKEEARKEEKAQDIELAKKVLAELDSLTPTSKKELDAVIIRLNMFIEGKRYTRNMKKDN